jgi:anti-anti-sigma regulatory factor
MFVEIENNKDSGIVELTLPEELRIANVEELKKDLLVAIDSKNPISIDGSKVNKIDTAAIQLLTALSHECKGNGHSIKWKGASDVLVSYVKLIGLHESLGL